MSRKGGCLAFCQVLRVVALFSEVLHIVVCKETACAEVARLAPEEAADAIGAGLELRSGNGLIELEVEREGTCVEPADIFAIVVGGIVIDAVAVAVEGALNFPSVGKIRLLLYAAVIDLCGRREFKVRIDKQGVGQRLFPFAKGIGKDAAFWKTFPPSADPGIPELDQVKYAS